MRLWAWCIMITRLKGIWSSKRNIRSEKGHAQQFCRFLNDVSDTVFRPAFRMFSRFAYYQGQTASGRAVCYSLVTALAIFLELGSVATFAQEGPDHKTITERFKSWTVSCVEAETRTCQMIQELVQEQSGQRLSALIVETREEDAAFLTILAPFGLTFSRGLQLSVDDAEFAKALFLTCLPSGCLVPVALDTTLLEKIRAGNKFVATGVTAANGKPVRIEFSLQGSAAALARLKELSVATVAE